MFYNRAVGTVDQAANGHVDQAASGYVDQTASGYVDLAASECVDQAGTGYRYLYFTIDWLNVTISYNSEIPGLNVD